MCVVCVCAPPLPTFINEISSLDDPQFPQSIEPVRNNHLARPVNLVCPVYGLQAKVCPVEMIAEYSQSKRRRETS